MSKTCYQCANEPRTKVRKPVLVYRENWATAEGEIGRLAGDDVPAAPRGAQPMRLPRAVLAIAKEAARHVLRRPVVGICAVATTRDGRFLLIRRRDTGEWALPGGTVEWGESLGQCIRRELLEEAGVEVTELGELSGVYSHPDRDWRFHAVTVVIRAQVTPPFQAPKNPLEIADVGLFQAGQLPEELSYQMSDMLRNAAEGKAVWE